MTEYWKSNAHYWCELCRVWMTDKQSTRATHEAGVKHQELLQKKLRSMRVNADNAKSEKKLVEATIGQIEADAAKQYAKDKAAEEAHTAATLGSWALDSGTGYLYNALHRYYFDVNTGMYYGGDPMAWTNEPKMPAAAKYKPAVAQTDERSSTGNAASGAGAGRSAGGSAPPRRVNIARVNATSHPLGGLGGHSMPTAGTIGGAKGVGGAATAAAASAAAVKRKREEVMKKLPAKQVSKEEAEAQAKREAARLRVQKRTMTTFGLA